MSTAPETATAAEIKFFICVSLQGPIIPGDYSVENATINVSYPEQVDLGLPTPIKIPKGVSTLFIVSWTDKKGKTVTFLKSKSFERNLPIYEALTLISKLLTAFKLVRVGHAEGMRIRTVGISDTLFCTSLINGIPTGNLNFGMRLDHRGYPWQGAATQPFDRHGTTELALPHINADTYPVARRYLRCFELLEHGFYKEAVIISHAILDDLVQEVIDEQIRSKGLTDEQSRDVLIRAIKESRLAIYLGPLLKILSGVSIDEIWPNSIAAISWLNRKRNEIAHAGSQDDRNTACKAIFVSIKTVAAPRSRKLIEADFPAGMFRQARIGAAWTLNPEVWVPTGESIENDEFD
jgi:hypothetical protein